MCTKTRRGIHAGLTPECSNVNGVRRPCTVLGALENARGRTELAATIPHHPPRALRILQLPGLLLLGGIPAEQRQGSRNDVRSPLQADGPAPSSNVHQQTLIPASFLGV